MQFLLPVFQDGYVPISANEGAVFILPSPSEGDRYTTSCKNASQAAAKLLVKRFCASRVLLECLGCYFNLLVPLFQLVFNNMKSAVSEYHTTDWSGEYDIISPLYKSTQPATERHPGTRKT